MSQNSQILVVRYSQTKQIMLYFIFILIHFLIALYFSEWIGPVKVFCQYFLIIVSINLKFCMLSVFQQFTSIKMSTSHFVLLPVLILYAKNVVNLVM